jgi:hypothetical protein
MSNRGVRVTGAALIAMLVVTRSAAARADDVPYEHVVGSFEGLGALGERYGASLELIVSPRDAFTLYPWTAGGASTGTHGLLSGVFTSRPTTSYTVQTRAEGIDLQYRRYVMPHGAAGRGARGAFFAVGVEAASFVTHGIGCTQTYRDSGSSDITCVPPVHQAWTYVAPSLDVGGQAILPFGLTFGGSVGARYRVVADGDLDESVMPFAWSVSHGSGLRPRIRAWLGWAFL